MNKELVFKALSSNTRLEIVEFLSSGPASVSQIATALKITQPSISVNLLELYRAEIVDLIVIGRDHFYRLSPEYLEETVTWLDRLLHSSEQRKATVDQDTTIYDLHFARTCYDHLAGVKGVEILDKMLERRFLKFQQDGKQLFLTDEGRAKMIMLGIEIPMRTNSRRKFAYGCNDWTVRRYHLGGALGSAVLKYLEKQGYIARIPGSREVRIFKDPVELFD